MALLLQPSTTSRAEKNFGHRLLVHSQICGLLCELSFSRSEPHHSVGLRKFSARVTERFRSFVTLWMDEEPLCVVKLNFGFWQPALDFVAIQDNRLCVRSRCTTCRRQHLLDKGHKNAASIRAIEHL